MQRERWKRDDRRLVLLTLIWAAGLVASGWRPFDRATWAMEVAPALILMLGGAYSYARVPAGAWVQDWLHLARNPYDRLGHFAQGFVPAIVFREALIRRGGLPRGGLTTFLVLACCLAVSAIYELIEFAAALALGQGAEAFLGTQGDVWDTQWDMLMCLIGAATALLTLSRLHDRQLIRWKR
ncbi:putative membrane protein [Sphingomonas sp. SORGH_AS 950]|uniref:DUF2238 domain-containing protein n=1 Tax=Sphingomonas sp. SORGH_AS_0950 TaxID=3041792 RepID=UPI0027810567|nr:DUF2238 domain-containing protein [Sphingomonas sp. SORGH_AS_0950]MDQ1158268.1 putative membrane protein [Sphingomonas sp. SORGH_AS_0950]